MKPAIVSCNNHTMTGRIGQEPVKTENGNVTIMLIHNMGKGESLIKNILVPAKAAEAAGDLLKKGAAIEASYFERPRVKDGKTYVNLVAKSVTAAQLREVADDAPDSEDTSASGEEPIEAVEE